MIVQNVSKTYDRLLFSDVSFQINRGLVTVKGPSGCGKSTLFRILKGQENPDSGTVNLEGDFSYMGQEPSLCYEESLRWNIRWLLESKVEKQEALKLCELLQFSDLIDKRIETLSGGERQKAELILCLSKNRDVYFLDEPFSSLDEESKRIAANLIQEKAKSKLVFVANHDQILVSLNADASIVFENGNAHYLCSKEKGEKISHLEIKKQENARVVFASLLSLVKKKKLSLCLYALFTFFFSLSFSYGTSFLNTKDSYQNNAIRVEHDAFDSHPFFCSNPKPCNHSLFTDETIGHVFLSGGVVFASSSKTEDFLFLSLDDFKLQDQENLVLPNGESYLLSDATGNPLLDSLRDSYFFSSLLDGKQQEKELLLVPSSKWTNLLRCSLSECTFTFHPEKKLSNLPVIAFEEANNSLTASYSNDHFKVMEDTTGFSLKTADVIHNGKTILKDLNYFIDDSGNLVVDTIQYQDFLLHYNMEYVSRKDEMSYLVFLKNPQFKQYGEENNLVPLDCVPLYYHNGKPRIFIGYTIFGFGYILLLFYLIFTTKGRKEEKQSIQKTIENNGVSYHVFSTSMIFLRGAFYSFVFLVSSLLYRFVFIPKANMKIVEISYGIHPDGYFYYSLEPMNSYFDSMTYPIPYLTFEKTFFLLALFLFILFTVESLLDLNLKKTSNQKSK